MTIKEAYQAKHAYFKTGATRPLTFRKKQLRNLIASLEKFEPVLLEALHEDVGKPAYEAYIGDLAPVHEEATFALRRLKRWMRPSRKATPLVHFPSSSHVIPEPKGVVLILGPWNYPVQLILSPLVGAIAAGNCAMLKPPLETPRTTEVLTQLIQTTFPPEYISIHPLEGEQVIPQIIAPHRFDHIFFTGSTRVGRLIQAAAADHLSPLTLELGGKSPAVVAPDANLDITAKRICWGKFYNAGQTCLCPDYVVAHESIVAALTDRMKMHLRDFYGDDPLQSPHLTRIIHARRFDRLMELMKGGTVLYGGRSNREKLLIEPTLLHEIHMEDAIMQEEVFGPLLPVLTYTEVKDIGGVVEKNPHPLAFYVFTKDRKAADQLIREIPFGGGCVNVPLVHLSNPRIPFGGRGNSGMGNYHGKAGFDTFSHFKSIMKMPFWPDLPFKYPPYDDRKMKWTRWFFGWR